MEIPQKDLIAILKKVGISLTVKSLNMYETTYKLISPAKRGAGYGGRWTNYKLLHLIEIATAYIMMNKCNETIIQAFVNKNMDSFPLAFQYTEKINSDWVYVARINALQEEAFKRVYAEKYYKDPIEKYGIDYREAFMQLDFKHDKKCNKKLAEAIVTSEMDLLYNADSQYTHSRLKMHTFFWIQCFVRFDLLFEQILRDMA